MAYPLLESPLGRVYFYNDRMISYDSDEAQKLKEPTDAVTYYETVRCTEGVLLFLEDHLERLQKSVKSVEAFSLDTDAVGSKAKKFLEDIDFSGDGNLRIVVTADTLLIHMCEANIPPQKMFETGINTNILKWERVDPNVKVFRGDYKKSVFDAFHRANPNGMPYEIILADRDDRLYEGSKSNFFVVSGNKVYSAPNDKILIGITRKRVIESLDRAGMVLDFKTFTIDELKELEDPALFVSSTPFDILPVTHIEDNEFDSVNNPYLQKISGMYREITKEYIKNYKQR